MYTNTDNLIPIAGLGHLHDAAKELQEYPETDTERDQIDFLMDRIFCSALGTISMQLDHAPDSPELANGFGRVLAVAKYCLVLCVDDEGDTIVYPQIAEQNQGVFVNGLIISACTGYDLGFTDGLPDLHEARWEDGAYYHLVNGPEEAESGFETGIGVYIPVLASDLYNPYPGKMN